MANNPNPVHVTAEYWWFIEQLELLDPADTVFAGAWGRSKPGGHCDAYGLWWHKDPKTGLYTWRDDYTLRHPDDKVLGTPLEQYGAATDWTFLSAQRGDFRNISKYGGRIAVAFANRDPRLKGWHEVLIQADMDKAPEGFNFRSWTTRVPDATHEWHGHFTCSRKYLRTLSVFQAMLSILRGEPLAQWQGTKGDDMIFAISDGDRKGYAGRAGGGTHEFAATEAILEQWRKDQGGAATVWVAEADVKVRLGVEVSALMGGGSSGTGLTEAQVRDIAEQEANEAVSGAKLVPPAN